MEAHMQSPLWFNIKQLCLEQFSIKSYWHVHIVGVGHFFTLANITNTFDGVAHRSENKKCIHGWVEDDVLIVGVINVMSVRCGSHLTWGLFTQYDSLQPLWSKGVGALPSLCPAWMLCPGASTDGMKETLNCGEKPKASTWGLTGWHYGGTNSMFTQPGSSSATTPGFSEFSNIGTLLCFFCCKYLDHRN